MTSFQFIDLPGIRLRAAVEGAGPLVVMVHGFPESWFSWRHQIGPIAQAGFTACAIDVRGYGGSDKPAGVADYLDRYGPFYRGLWAEMQQAACWTPSIAGSIEAERRRDLPADQLAARQAWRDRRLMAFLAHRQTVAESDAEQDAAEPPSGS